MTLLEIQSIIEVCARANVRKFSFSELRIEFGEGGPASLPMAAPTASEPNPPTDATLSAQHEQQSKDYLEVEEALAKEERLALMLIEDPLEAERLIANGEVEDFKDGDGDDSGEFD